MESYRLEFHDDHPIATIDGLRCLIDTGSPVSIGRSPVRLLGASRPVQNEVLGLSAEGLSEMVGTPIDVLLGVDVLHTGPFLFDWNHASITFDLAALPFEGQPVPTRRLLGIPVVTFRQAGASHAGFLDSGAKLSYLPEARSSEFPADGEAEDFYPGFGRFTSDTVRAPIELGGIAIDARFGVLPPMLAAMLGAAGVGWILGSDVFKQLRVLVDLGASRVLVACPPA